MRMISIVSCCSVIVSQLANSNKYMNYREAYLAVPCSEAIEGVCDCVIYATKKRNIYLHYHKECFSNDKADIQFKQAIRN